MPLGLPVFTVGTRTTPSLGCSRNFDFCLKHVCLENTDLSKEEVYKYSVKY